VLDNSLEPLSYKKGCIQIASAKGLNIKWHKVNALVPEEIFQTLTWCLSEVVRSPSDCYVSLVAKILHQAFHNVIEIGG